MVTSTDVQLAKVEERLSNLGGEIRDDIKELKEVQEEIWRSFRKHQDKSNDNEKLILSTLNEVKALVVVNKKHCDDRFQTIELRERSKNLRHKARMGVLIFFATSTTTVLCNLAVAVAKAKWGWV